MPTKKPSKQVERFKAGVFKFVEMFSDIAGLKEIDRKINARNGVTTVKIVLEVVGGIPATRAAKLGKRMAEHFPAWFSPTHYEQYDLFKVDYKRGEGTIIVQGKI